MNIYAGTGRLTKTPIIKEVESNGKSFKVTDFTIMVATSKKNSDGSTVKAPIHCQVFGNSADYISKYAVKGTLIGVSGEMQVNQWGEGENFKTKTFVNVDKIEINETKEQTEIRRKALEQAEKTPS